MLQIIIQNQLKVKDLLAYATHEDKSTNESGKIVKNTDRNTHLKLNTQSQSRPRSRPGTLVKRKKIVVEEIL